MAREQEQGGSGLPERSLRVSARSNPHAVAGAFAGVLRDRGRAEVLVVGAGALNQAIKAVAIARGFMAAEGVELVCVPEFADVVIDAQRRTGLRLVVLDRSLPPSSGADGDSRPLSSGA